MDEMVWFIIPVFILIFLTSLITLKIIFNRDTRNDRILKNREETKPIQVEKEYENNAKHVKSEVETEKAINLINRISQLLPPEDIARLIGLKSFYIGISMLAWASCSIYLNVQSRNPDITFFSIKFLFFIFGGVFIAAWIIGYIFFNLFWKSIPQLLENKINQIFWHKRIFAVLDFVLTCSISNSLFKSFYDL